MCAAVAVLWSEIPLELIECHGLVRRAYERRGEREIRFYYRDPEPLLPVVHRGQVVLAKWGSRDRRSSLPSTGWTWRQSVLDGKWGRWNAEACLIPATFGWENGVWFAVRQGMEGVVVKDEAGQLVAYVVCEPPTHYFSVMCRTERMPRLVGQVI